jgi:hypothetical protein
MIDDYYWGDLVHYDRGFIFHPNGKHASLKDIGKEFGEVVLAWHR